MKLLPQRSHQRWQSKAHGFTLTEVMVVASLVLIVSLGLYGVVQAGMTVGIRSLAINQTANASRSSLDRAEQLLQIAYDSPVPIQRNGAKQTDATLPAPGVRFYRYAGGPYEIDIPSGGLSGNTTTLSVFGRTATGNTEGAPPPPPAPKPNDVLVINTTILMSGSSSQIYAYIQSVSSTQAQTRTSSAGNSVSGIRYNLTLSTTLTDNGGVVPSGTNTVTATLIRPTALLVIPRNGRRELRLYESFANTTNLDVNGTHRVLTDQIGWTRTGTATGTDAFATPFRVRKMGERTFVNSDFRVRDTRYDNYLRASNINEFSTFTVLQSRVPVKCNPNE